MTASFGKDVLAVFDVPDDARGFLADVLESGTAPPHETQSLLDQSLLAGAEDWHALIACARSVEQSRHDDPFSLGPNDVLAHVWLVLKGLALGKSTPPPPAWEETDRLIACAQRLARDATVVLSCSSPAAHKVDDDGGLEPGRPRAERRRRPTDATWRYWVDAEPAQALAATSSHLPKDNGLQLPSSRARRCLGSSVHCSRTIGRDPAARPQKSAVSPYFATSPDNKAKAKRRPAGTVSCVPFPPLSSPSFGIVQEEVAREPFWLLIAVTFLIKTSGQLAIPAFHRVRQRFPTPRQLADPANAEELTGMIRHLGLAVNRVAYIQKYAKAFLERPPRPGVGYRVRNYDKRDLAPRAESDRRCPGMAMADTGWQPTGDDEDAEAWEIGHMTQGKYAIDSWRIFCRDELLRRAEDWNGKGREPEFQPEWMRVMPQDKELRAYLRWMWMRQGWEWDPTTGERRVLADDMRRAVDEARVAYDDTGGLRMLDGPRETLR